MATTNKLLRDLEEQRARELASLSQLSRDLDAALKGPAKDVKIKVAPKYVAGVSKSQGDSQYASNLRAFGAKQLGRAFGMNKGLQALEQELTRELENQFGTGNADLREYTKLCVQTIIHLIAQGATNIGGSGSALSEALQGGYNTVKNALLANNKLTDALSRLNNPTNKKWGGAWKGNVYTWLYPINLAHIESLQAKALPKLARKRDYMRFIAQGAAQAAVLNYIATQAKNPPDNVLLPAGISGSRSESEVIQAFAKYPAKDVEATYNFYKKAVDASYRVDTGVRTGDVEASLKAASQSLKTASSALSLTGIDIHIQKIFKDALLDLSKEVSKISYKSNEAQDDIALVTADLFDLLGIDTTNTLVYGLDGGFLTAVGSILPQIPSRFGASAVGEINVQILDAQDDIRPTSLRLEQRTKPRLAEVRNSLALAILSLSDAYTEVFSASFMTKKPLGVAPRKVVITSEFTRLVERQISDTNKLVSGMADNAASRINRAAFDAGYNEAVILFGLEDKIQTGSRGTTALSNSTMQQIADGVNPTLDTVGASGRTIEKDILAETDRVLRQQTGVTSSQRRATRDLVIRAATLLQNSIEGMRVQALNTGVQIRRNPASDKLKSAGIATGALLSDHATAALANRFVDPVAGTVTAHLCDYGTSVATAGLSYHLHNQGRMSTSTRNAAIAGAVGHALLRFGFKNIEALRWSSNPVIQALQIPTNGLAKLLGDDSMSISSRFPASTEGMSLEEVTEYVLNIAATNSCTNLVHIGAQLALANALIIRGGGEGESGRQFIIANEGLGEASADSTRVTTIVNLIQLRCLVMGLGGVKDLVIKGDFLNIVDASGQSEFLTSDECKAKVVEAATLAKKLIVEASTVEGFILENGYNMDVYSGEDQVSYLQPAPIVTAKSGIAQLDNAIARAKRLEAHDMLQEGIEDLTSVAIIRATPATARAIENAAIGTSLGQSRMNPATELVALEVEGANGLWAVAPERQQSVPQGALNHAKIGHAQDIDVSPQGLFTRGVFQPMYGRK